MSASHCERDQNRRRVEALASQVASITRAAAYTATPEWVSSVVCAVGLLDSEISQPIMVALVPARVAIPGELVRVDLNIPTGMPETLEVQFLLHLEIEPFIVGVGKVVVDDAPNGIIVRRVDAWENDGCHIKAPVEVTAEMIEAGANEYISYDARFEDLGDAVLRIWKSMNAAKTRDSSAQD
jgi:hypothetical protein